jgi:hypothetical protein
MASGFTVSRSGTQGHLFTVQTIHMGVCMHTGIDIGDIFFKDGDVEVSTYSLSHVRKLLKTATLTKQASFSFLTPLEYQRQYQAQPPHPLPPQPHQPPQATTPAAVSGFTVGRSHVPGRPYTVRTIHINRFAHPGVEIGDVFYRDGDVDVVTYTHNDIDELLRTATPARQATFSFLSITTLSSCYFTAKRACRGQPYIVTTIHTTRFNHTGKIVTK